MVKEDKRIRIMRDAPPLRAILLMSIPVILGMLVNIVYNLVDTWFIGLLGDELQLAASSLANPIFILTMALASLIGTGGSSYLSRSLGAGQEKKAEKTLTIALVLVLIFGMLTASVGIIFRKQIPILLGASKLSFQYTLQYTSILLIGGIFVIGNFVLGQLIRAEGSTKLSMIGMMLGAVANIILDPIFIFAFNWGIVGAAVATVLGNALSVLFFIGCYRKKKTFLPLSFREFSFDLNIVKEIFTVGIPVTTGQALVSSAQMIQNNLASNHGDVMVAGLGISLKLMTIGTFVFMGFSAGCQPLMGYNYGSGNYKRLQQFIKTGIVATTIIGVCLLLLIYLTAPYLIVVFTPLVEVQKIGVLILRTLSLSLPFMGGITLCTGTFQAMGKPIKSFILTISRQGILYIPLLFILNRYFGWTGMLFSQPVTDLIMIFVSSIFLLKALKNLNESI